MIRQQTDKLDDQGSSAVSIDETTSGRPRRYRSLIKAVPPLLIFALCAFYLFWQSIVDQRVFFENDTLHYYFPIERLIDRSLDLQKLPFWTPYIFAGHPLFADGESGMLYPPNLIAYWLFPTTAQAMIALRILRFFLAGLFAYLYGRSLRLDRPAATVVGLSFAYGSFMVGQIHHTNLGTTASWLPLIMAAVEWSFRASPRGRLAYLVLAAAALGAATLTMHANPLLMMLFLLGLYVPFRIMVCKDVVPHSVRVRLGRLAMTLILPVGIGLALGAVQLLPTWELGSFSRGRGMDYNFATAFATPPANLITLIFPYFFRDASDAYWSPWFRWNTTLYVGIAPLVLAAIAVITMRRRIVFFYAAIVLVGLALAFGDYSPLKLYRLLWELPFFSVVRGPARFLFWSNIGLAVLAGFGMQSLARGLPAFENLRGWKYWPRGGPSRPLFYWIACSASLLTLSLVGALVLASRLTGEAPGRVKEFLNASYLSLRGAGLERKLTVDPVDALRRTLEPNSEWTLRALVLLLLTAGLLWAWYRWRSYGLIWQGAIILLIAVDLLGFAGHFHPRVSVDRLRGPDPVGEFLEKNTGLGRVLTLWPVVDNWPNRLLPLQVAQANGYSSLTPERTEVFLGRANQGLSHFLQLLDVRYVVAYKGWAPAWLKTGRMVFASNNQEVYELVDALPRAFVVSEYQVGTPEQILNGIADFAFDPNRVVWLERKPDTAPNTTPSSTRNEPPAQIVAYSNERVTIQAQNSSTGFLVLTDSYYPGWTAYVDGRAQPVYRADYLFRAVMLPPGQHTVEFVFESISLRLGAWTSICAAILMLLILAAATHSGRSQRNRALKTELRASLLEA